MRGGLQVTPNEFRSWVGQRRILRLKGKVGDGKIDSYYEPYEGPTYLFGTNKKISSNKFKLNSVAFTNNKDPRVFQRRPYEQL